MAEVKQGAVQRQHPWADAEIDLLRRLFADGLTMSQIARRLEAAGFAPRTRNAVIGKCTRLGLQMNPTARAITRGAHARNAGRVAAPIVKRGERATPAPVVLAPPPIAPPPQVVHPTITELPPRSCKWPVGYLAGEHRFCGAARPEGQPYCTAHAPKAVSNTAGRFHRNADRAVQRVLDQLECSRVTQDLGRGGQAAKRGRGW